MRVYNKGPVTKRSMPFWPILNPLGDPFGQPVYDRMSVLEATSIICEAADRGLIEMTSAHDCDLVKFNPNNPADDLDPKSKTCRTLVQIRDQLRAHDVEFHAITCDLHSDPLFKNGGLSNPDPAIRKLARLKVRRAIRIGAFLGAKKFIYWDARDGWVVGVITPFGEVFKWIAEGLDDVYEYIQEQGFTNYEGGTIEPKPNEPTGHSFIPTAGHAVGFIMTMLKHPEFWGVNPELRQHEGMALLDAVTCVAYLKATGKLSFFHLGNQMYGHEDNDLPPLVGPEGLKETAQMFCTLMELGWHGVVEYDCHMLRQDAGSDQCSDKLLFIELCSTGLAIALVMAKRQFDCKQITEFKCQANSAEADLFGIAAMCGISRKEICAMRGEKGDDAYTNRINKIQDDPDRNTD